MAVEQPSWLKSEWQQFIQSKTVKIVLLSEIAAVGIFANGVVDGTQKLDLQSLKGWLAAQAVGACILTLRHAFAGIETLLESKGVPKEALMAAEEKGKALVVAAVAETHPELAAIVTKQLKGTPPA